MSPTSPSAHQQPGVPMWRRPLFALLGRIYPDIQAERVWRRLDLEEEREGEVLLERRLFESVRPFWGFIAVLQLAFFAIGVFAIWVGGPGLMEWLRDVLPQGYTWLAWSVPIGLGWVAHGLFILVVHEATHLNILGKPWDRWIGNVALGMLLLPFLAEKYQHTHYVHHRCVNGVDDNNWTRYRDALWKRSRVLYALYELLPVLNNLDRLAEKVPVRWAQIGVSWLAALAMWAAATPSLTYYVLLVVGLNAVNASRLWIEHYGEFRGRVSNTYWCPFSFGIANHDVHHRQANIPALVLMAGLWFRRRDVTIFSAPFRMLFQRGWRHFRLQQGDFDGVVR